MSWREACAKRDRLGPQCSSLLVFVVAFCYLTSSIQQDGNLLGCWKAEGRRFLILRWIFLRKTGLGLPKMVRFGAFQFFFF